MLWPHGLRGAPGLRGAVGLPTAAPHTPTQGSHGSAGASHCVTCAPAAATREATCVAGVTCVHFNPAHATQAHTTTHLQRGVEVVVAARGHVVCLLPLRGAWHCCRLVSATTASCSWTMLASCSSGTLLRLVRLCLVVRRLLFLLLLAFLVASLAAAACRSRVCCCRRASAAAVLVLLAAGPAECERQAKRRQLLPQVLNLQQVQVQAAVCERAVGRPCSSGPKPRFVRPPGAAASAASGATEPCTTGDQGGRQ